MCGFPVKLENAILCTKDLLQRLTVEAVGFLFILEVGSMTRREAREQAFILVFEQTVREEPMDSILHDAVEARDLIPSSFAEREALGVEEHREEVDQAIEKHIRGWSLRRLSKVTLALLRLAVYEMLWEESIPASVTINEAVELAKIYGGKDDASYINGVLASVAKSSPEKAKDKPMSELFLGIDTSNYTTSSALFDGERVLENRKMLLPVKQGGKGPSPKRCGLSSCAAVAPGAGPPFGGVGRPPQAIGVSLTPQRKRAPICHASWWGKIQLGFWGRRGKSPWRDSPTSRATLRQHCIPLGSWSFWKNGFWPFTFPAAPLRRSWSIRGRRGVPQVKLVAHSLDLKAGQAVDRVGVMLGLGFPCGPELERLALKWGREDPIPPGAERQRLFSLRH